LQQVRALWRGNAASARKCDAKENTRATLLLAPRFPCTPSSQEWIPHIRSRLYSAVDVHAALEHAGRPRRWRAHAALALTKLALPLGEQGLHYVAMLVAARNCYRLRKNNLEWSSNGGVEMAESKRPINSL
jgi:hypothetical protein